MTKYVFFVLANMVMVLAKSDVNGDFELKSEQKTGRKIVLKTLRASLYWTYLEFLNFKNWIRLDYIRFDIKVIFVNSRF